MFKVKTKYNLTSLWCFYCWLWPESVYQYSVSTFNFEQAFVSRVWKAGHNVLKTQKATYFFLNKSARPISFSDLSLHRVELNYEQMTTLWPYILQGRRKLFYGEGWVGKGGRGRGWVKMSATMVGRQQKIFKKNWLKRPIAVPKNEIWSKI